MATAKNVQAEQPDDVAKVMAEAEAIQADETVRGGRYELNGQLVDANGKPLKGAKTEDGE